MAPVKKKILIFFLIFLAIIFAFLGFLARRPQGVSGQVEWATAFSKYFAQKLGLDWQKTYLAMLDDLGAKKLRLPIYWQDIEPISGGYFFDDYDWMIEQARQRKVQLILVIGRRLPRWPECHVPEWAVFLDEKSQQKRVLALLETIIRRYKDKTNILAWQVENEPFFDFGECPKLDVAFLDKEISLVRLLDPGRPIMLTDSGELGFWLSAAKRADIFGTTLYRVVWNKTMDYFKYPIPTRFFWMKANWVHLFYPGKKIVVSELQAEPWGPKMIYETLPQEHFESMPFEQFCDNIEYAKQVGFPEVYLWGAEWWWWLKEKHNHPEFWDYAKELFHS